jgi:O-antigen ligase
MLIEIIVFLSIVAFFLFQRNVVLSMQLFLFILPFHSFVKNLFQYLLNGGGLFSFWKEIAIILMIFKLYNCKKLIISKKVLLLFLIFFLLITLYFFVADNFSNALPTFRDHIFPLLACIVFMCLPIDTNQARKIFLTLIYSSILSNILGFVQYFYLNIPISMIMRTIDFIDSEGYVQYTSTSFRIMGLERMNGVLGSPNLFGLYNAFSFVLIVGLFLRKTIYDFSSIQLVFIKIGFLLTLFGLIFSFSRAGWMLVIICFIIYFSQIKPKYKIKFGILFLSGVMLIIFFLTFFFPKAIEVFTNSISGREASAADRTQSVLKAISIISNSPFGHGLGSTDIRFPRRSFFVESAFMNISFEIGVFGFIVLLVIFIYLLYKLYTRFRIVPISFVSFSLTIASLVVSFFSINTYSIPFIYLWWVIIGIGLNRNYFNHNLSIR